MRAETKKQLIAVAARAPYVFTFWLRYISLAGLYATQLVLVLTLFWFSNALAANIAHRMMTAQTEGVVIKHYQDKPVYEKSFIGRAKHYMASVEGWDGIGTGIKIRTNDALADAVRYNSVIEWQEQDGTKHYYVFTTRDRSKMLNMNEKYVIRYNPAFPSLVSTQIEFSEAPNMIAYMIIGGFMLALYFTNSIINGVNKFFDALGDALHESIINP